MDSSTNIQIQNACRAVPQAMKRNVGKPRFLDDSLEGTVCRVGIDQFFRVAQAREDPFGADGFLSLFQHADNAFGQDDRADTGVGFRIADRDSAPDRDDLTCHAELAFRFVQVLPAQSADLTFAQSRHTFEVEEVPPPRFVLNDFQKLFELFLVIDFAFRAVQCGDCCAVGRIFDDDMLLHCHLKALVHHHMHCSDRTARERFSFCFALGDAPFFEQFYVELLHIPREDRRDFLVTEIRTDVRW